MTIYYIDPENGNDSNDGLSFANRKKTINSAYEPASPGDEIRIIGNTPVNTGLTAVWEKSNRKVIASDIVGRTVNSCDPYGASWYPGFNVTMSFVTTRKLGTNSAQVNIPSSFTTGEIISFRPIGVDFEGYSKLCFWVRVNNASATYSGMYIDLTYPYGGTPGPTIRLPFTLAPTTNWQRVVLDNGSPFPDYIGHATIGTTVKLSTTNIQMFLDNFFVSDIDFRTCIGQSEFGQYYPIDSIDGNEIILGNQDMGANTPSERTYWGPEGEFPLYTVRTIKDQNEFTTSATAGGHVLSNKTITGTNEIVISGGWNPTDMSTQDAVTYLDGIIGYGYGLELSAADRTRIENLNFVHFNRGFSTAANTQQGKTGLTIKNCSALCSGTNGFYLYVTGCVLENCFSGFNYNRGIEINGTANTIRNCQMVSNKGFGLNPSGTIDILYSEISNNFNSGAYPGNSSKFYYCNFSNNGSGPTKGSLNSNSDGTVLKNCTFNDIREVAWPLGSVNYFEYYVYSHNHDNTPGYHVIFTWHGRIVTDYVDVYSPGSISWQIECDSSTYRTKYNPIHMKGAVLFVQAGNTYTIQVPVKRNNSGIVSSIRIKGGQLAGIDEDLIATSTITDDWELLSLVVEPEEDGSIELEFLTYGTSGYWGKFSGNIICTKS